MSPGMTSALPKAAPKAIERETPMNLDLIAERTQTVLDAGRFQPRDEEGLERLARKYYFSMALPASYYPKSFDDRWAEWAIEQGTSRAYIAMLDGAALGVQPSMAVRQIHVINGVPTMSADLMFGRMLATGLLRRDDFSIVADKTLCVLTIGTMTRKPENRLVITCKLEDFKHLHAKDNWRNDPEAMLVARAKSRAVRRHAPDLLVGVYSTEEMQDVRESLAVGHYEVPPEFMPHDTRTAPEAPVVTPAPASSAPTSPLPVDRAAEAAALQKDIESLSDGATLDDWRKLYERAKTFIGTEFHVALQAAWAKNGGPSTKDLVAS